MNPQAFVAVGGESSQSQNPPPPLHQPVPIRVSTGSPTDAIEELRPPAGGAKSKELQKLESFNKAGYCDDLGPAPAARTRTKTLLKLQSDHNEWVETLYDQVDYFLSWTGPILPHEEASFQRNFAKLQEDLSYLCSNAGMMNEKLANSGFTHDVNKTNVEVQRIQESVLKVKEKFKVVLSEGRSRSRSRDSASIRTTSSQRRALEMKEALESSKARQIYESKADALQQQLAFEEVQKENQRKEQDQKEETQRKEREVQEETQRKERELREETQMKLKRLETQNEVKRLFF